MNTSGKGPLTLANSTENPPWGLKLYGRSVQNGTPKPDASELNYWMNEALGVIRGDN